MNRSIISTALSNGFSVVVDDTNFNLAHEEWLRKEIEFLNLGDHKIELEVKFIDTHPDICIERDSKRLGNQKVGEAVIRKMAEQSYKLSTPENYDVRN